MTIKWILERDVFPDNHERLATAAANSDHEVISWSDDWHGTDKLNEFKGEKVIFHGCLANAANIFREPNLHPGAFCNVEAFNCTNWYPQAEKWIVNSDWIHSTVEKLVENPEEVLQLSNVKESFFVRPNSPLKPFSGRIIERDDLSYQALDHGFYYDDKSLEIIISPVKNIINEWRYVIIGREVITGSGYMAETRTEVPLDPKGAQWDYAREIASNINPPEEVYVMDICLVEDQLNLLELNPFSGADLYACDRDLIVQSIEKIIAR